MAFHLAQRGAEVRAVRGKSPRGSQGADPAQPRGWAPPATATVSPASSRAGTKVPPSQGPVPELPAPKGLPALSSSFGAAGTPCPKTTTWKQRAKCSGQSSALLAHGTPADNDGRWLEPPASPQNYNLQMWLKKRGLPPPPLFLPLFSLIFFFLFSPFFFPFLSPPFFFFNWGTSSWNI